MGKFLVTGAAGFVGYHTADRLLKDGHTVVGLDNLSDYYDVCLKQDRLELLAHYPEFRFVRMDLADNDRMAALFRENMFDTVVNLAAQPGVRYSVDHPEVYAQSNLVGFLNVLEGCRRTQVGHLVFASSSSVYGSNTQMPNATSNNVDHPVSLYAATKKANELMAHSYSHLYGIPTTGLRFFTVYGPWGRPDMATFLFTTAILSGTPIQVFNHGRMKRDFTYVDDIVEGVVRVAARPPKPDPDWVGSDPARSTAPYRIYNLGNNTPVELGRFIEVLEGCLGREAVKEYRPMQAGDVLETYADTDDLMREIGYCPSVSIEEGLRHFVEWYRGYYDVPSQSLPQAPGVAVAV